MDGILKLFENNVSGVVRERGSDLDSEDEFDLGKKIADLNDNVKNLRREIAEMKADQNAVEVKSTNFNTLLKYIIKLIQYSGVKKKFGYYFQFFGARGLYCKF